MTLNDFEWPFYVKFSLLQTHFQQLRYILTVESVYTRDHWRCVDVRKRTVIRRVFGTCGKTADLS